MSCADLVPGDFIHVIGDAHVYHTHIRPLQEQLHKLPKPFPVSIIAELVLIHLKLFCYMFSSIIYAILLRSVTYFMQILKINSEKKDIDSFVAADFELIGYDPHQKIEMKMAV
jgi:dihydrofolate reductase/thymidylate synthase